MNIRANAQRALGVIACALLASCGGGGGGSEGASSESVSLVNVRVPALQTEAYESGDPTVETWSAFRILADLQGNIASLNGKQLFVVVEDPDGFVESASPVVSATGIDSGLDVHPKVFAPSAGRYNKGLRIFICFDAACSRQFVGSPLSVPYDVTVYRGLKINDNKRVELTAPANTQAQVTVPITLPDGLLLQDGLPRVEKNEIISFPPAFDWQIDLGAAPTATITGKPMAAGSYSANLVLNAEVQTPKGERRRLQAQVPVTYTVTP